jgi:hypothetical protein
MWAAQVSTKNATPWGRRQQFFPRDQVKESAQRAEPGAFSFHVDAFGGLALPA